MNKNLHKWTKIRPKNICTNIANDLKFKTENLWRIWNSHWWSWNNYPILRMVRIHSEIKKQTKIQNDDDCFFCNVHGIVYLYWVAEGQTFRQHYYLLANVREIIKTKQPELHKNKTNDLHQYYTLAIPRYMSRCF